jgi:hypothetical protein
VIVRVPDAEPTAIGANVTETVQEKPGAMLTLQVLVWLKGAVAVTLVTCMGPVPVFCTVTLLALLVVPSTWDEKLRLAGVTVATGAVPVPVSVTVCETPRLPESSLTVSEPLTAPATDGVKVMETVQFDPAGRRLGQLLVWENPPLAEKPEKSSGLPPKFVTVMGSVELVPRF